MDMLEALLAILKGDKSESCILADWLEDHHSNHPEFPRYHRLLKKPDTLRLQTVIDVIVKFGPKRQRSLIMKIIRQAKRAKNRPHAKGVLQAFMGKNWSLTRPWFMIEEISKRLVGPD